MKVYSSSVGIRFLIVLLLIVNLLTGCGSALTTAGIKKMDAMDEFAGPKLGNNPEQNTQSDRDSALDTTKKSDSELGSNLDTGSNQRQEPNPPGTPVRPFYSQEGEAPKAPGLAMKSRRFKAEPQKIVYLTFDDGPHPSTTPRILEILEEEKVQATFFVIGSEAEKYPDLLKAEYEGGYGIGNHTYSHNYSEIYEGGPEAFLDNIRKGEDIIERITGERPAIIRAPGGTHTHLSVSLFNLLDAHNYLIYDWNVSIGDTASPKVPVNQLVGNLQTQMKNKNRAIILMHDAGGKLTTVDALPLIIKHLKDEGYEFGKLSTDVMPIIFTGGFSR